jgi:hypothetical protein
MAGRVPPKASSASCACSTARIPPTCGGYLPSNRGKTCESTEYSSQPPKRTMLAPASQAQPRPRIRMTASSSRELRASSTAQQTPPTASAKGQKMRTPMIGQRDPVVRPNAAPPSVMPNVTTNDHYAKARKPDGRPSRSLLIGRPLYPHTSPASLDSLGSLAAARRGECPSNTAHKLRGGARGFLPARA